MTDSELQKAVGAAWPAIEAVVQSTAKGTPEGKALTAMKEGFIQVALPGTATHLPPTGEWKWGERASGPPVYRSRTFKAAAPKGLVDQVVYVTLDQDALSEIRLKKATNEPATVVTLPPGTPAPSTAPAPPVAVPITAKPPAALPLAEIIDITRSPGPADVVRLASAAVTQQIDYAMRVLLPSHTETDSGSLLNVIGNSRASLGMGALTALVRPGSVDWDETTKRHVRRALGGGTLVEVPWDPLCSDVLLLPHKPAGAVWYTAVNLHVGWDAVRLWARISVISRLLLDAKDVPRYRAVFSDGA